MRSRAIVLSTLLLCISVIHLSVANKIGFYIHPRYELFTVVLCSIGLLFLSIGWYLDSHRKPKKTDLFFVAIALIGLAYPASSLSQQVASNRAQNQITTASTREVSSFDTFSQDLSRFELVDWVSYFSTNPKAEQVVGKSARVTGFIYTDTSGQRYIGRFRINCCAVDATPLGIQLYAQDKSTSISEGAWYELSGVFQASKQNNATQFVLDVQDAKLIAEPEFPYVY